MRLSTRLGLSYLAFLVMLALSVAVLAWMQVVSLAILAAVLVSFLAGAWFARSLTRPLVRLSGELQAAAEGDFSRRIPVRGKDEFSQLAQAYNHLVERLGEAERERSRVEQARRDLVAHISHDLRTPLNSIAGFSEALASEEVAPEQRERYQGLIRARVAALDGLLSDLLELSRLQALPSVNRAPVDLAELIRRQLIDLMPEIEAAGLELDVDLPDSLPQVDLDERLIRRALANLVLNARHGQRAHRIAVSLEQVGAEVALRVADDGQGIPPEELPMLFDRYYRGTSATASGGSTGLGLAIVKQIAVNHGGRVEVVTGQGTAFTLWLPL